MKILALETASNVASIALATKDAILAEYTINNKKTHSQTLLPMIDEMLNMLEMDIKDVDAIAVSAGPGSYTGLRIASATAKGLAMAIDKPIISIPTIDAMAYGKAGVTGLICPMLDARRGQVFTGVYTFVNGDFQIVKPQMIIEIKDLVPVLNELNEKVYFLGDGVEPNLDYIKQNITAPFEVAPMQVNRQRASFVASLAIEYYEAGNVSEAKDHVPNYLKVTQAEREYEEKKANA